MTSGASDMVGAAYNMVGVSFDILVVVLLFAYGQSEAMFGSQRG